MLETTDPPTRWTADPQADLRAALDGYLTRRMELVDRANKLADARHALAEAEADAWQQGQVVGTNDGARQRCLAALTVHEADTVALAEREHRAAQARLDCAEATLRVARTLATGREP